MFRFAAAPLCIIMSAMSALGAEPLRIAVSAPLSGPYALLGRQIVAGAEAARTALPGADIELVTVDDRCDAAGAKEAAAEAEAQNVSAVIGFLCASSLLAALPKFRERKLPVIALGVRAANIAADARKNGDLLFRLSPNSGQEAEAIANLLLPLWRKENFAIIDDGTIHSRELAESFRAAAEEKGLKPAFVDTFRPALENQFAMLNRLKRSGATHVFVGGDRDDIAVLARDAAEKGVNLTIAGGEALGAAAGDVAMPDNVLMVGLPEAARLAEAQSVVSALAADKEAAEGYFLPAYAAIQLIAQSASLAKDPASLAAVLAKAPHETAIGPIRFNAIGDRADNPYRLMISKSGSFQDYQ